MVVINKINMFHHSVAMDDTHSHHSLERSLHTLIDGLKQKDLVLKRDQIISTLLEDAPRSYTKLLGKDPNNKDFTSQERIRSSTKYVPSHNLEPRMRHTQKNFFRVLEEQHRLISRQNMQLLGLTIQKITYVPPKKRNRATEIAQGMTATIQPSEVLNFENSENIPEHECLLEKPVLANNRQHALSKRPQSIRVRGKQGGTDRRRSVKQVNAQYQNPIYEARILSYRELLFKLQWSYGMYAEMEREEELRSDRRYKAWIGGGNNSPLVRELMKRRFWWQLTEDKNNLDVNFIWTQLKVPEYFKKQTQAALWMDHIYPKTEELKESPTKESPAKEPSKDLTMRSKSKREREKEKEWLKDQQYLYKIMPEFQSLNYSSMIRPFRSKALGQKQRCLPLKQWVAESERMHNHLTSNFHLGNKKALFYNLKEYYQITGGNLFKSIPLTFHIKKGTRDPQYKRFIAYYKKRQIYIKKQEKEQENGTVLKNKMRNIWIVKPGELTNRGNGITVIDEVYELDAIIKSQGKHGNGIQKTFIVQLYIDRPFLYKKRKFDIRHYLMVTHLHGLFKAYWFKQGYIRTASYDFDVHNFDREIHLTNDAIQKYTPMYGRYEPANKISYTEFQKYLDTTYPKEKYNFQEQILTKMKDIGLDAVRSTFLKLSPERNRHNFEVFGLDFMIDSEFQPYLIEVNTNPCLELVCPLLTRIIPQMLDQALRLSLDVIYPPPTHYPNTTKHLVPEASLENLKWELIFDERVEGKQLRQYYKGRRGDMMAEIGDVSDDEVYEDIAQQALVLEELL